MTYVANINIMLHIATGCQDTPVGIADSSIIPDVRFTASSYYDTTYTPKRARLNGGMGWAPKKKFDPNDYLQIDLGEVFVICAVATQGYGAGRDEWTTEYKISISLFRGNADKTTVVKNILEYPVLVRYIRFIPTTFNNWKVLRVECYGIKKRCQDSPVGIADSSIIPDDRFTASSYYDHRYVPMNARLNGADRGWRPRTATDPNDYLQIDLGEVYAICAVATQGSGSGRDKWTAEYKISTSLNQTSWTSITWKYKTCTSMLFPGNTDSNTVVKNALDYPVLVRFIRFIPTQYHNWKALRIEVYGIKKRFSCSSQPVGIGSGKIPDSKITSSSAYNSTTSPSKARLNYIAGSSWCAARNDPSPYLQINLGSPYIICGIATQGDHMTDQWVQSYNMLTSNDGSTFTRYMENSQVKSFTGNFESDTAVKNLLYDGIVTQHIRVAPTSHYGSTSCMRTELYGIKQRYDGGT
ncbi:venom prothrombin activator pseutarin-C non-catalytic subunit-like [Actinia tenebrosa]|uniref:Venom prothrombin activator pseutarin-C non-catalytic subunit-like n=1 Tax=Actinia tenebrosa TaxID=6105 RepID=A0A6P8H2S2_ACTTE|nr:venom prothrombin activator pseutarin-C non-catalytic subunit-like [Actinia tenebrosa]